MKPYYYVYRVGYGQPTIKHATLDDAASESERLAGKHPGEIFEILECLGVTRTVNPQTLWMDGVVPPHICARHRIMDDTCCVCGKSLANVRPLAPADNQTVVPVETARKLERERNEIARYLCRIKLPLPVRLVADLAEVFPGKNIRMKDVDGYLCIFSENAYENPTL